MLPIRRIPAAVSIGLGIGLSIIAFAATAHAEQAVWAAIDIPRWDRPVATLDAIHARLVVYAVNDHAGDLWTASLDSLTRWNRHPLAGPAPGDAGGSITSVGDSRDGRLYVAGDASVGEATWTLDVALDAWRRIGNGLDRDGAALAVDHAHRRLIAFGGTQYSPFNNSTAYLHDVLVLAADSNAVWTTLATQGTPPLGRTFAGVAMDETNDRLLVFGGLQQNNLKVDETWALDLTSSPPTWQFLMPGGATPPARVRAAVTLDAEHHRLLMHGGQNAAILHDTWALDLSLAGANWTNLTTATQPLDLVGPAAVFDSLGGRWFFAGGQAGGPARRDLQVFATRGTPAWSHPIDDPVGPPRGAIAGAVRDGARQRLIAVLEPTSSSTTASEIWAHDFDLLGGWHLLGAIDPGVSANRDRIVVDSLGDRVLFVRGGGPVVVDAMALANSPALTRLITNGVPPSRQTGLGAAVDAPRARLLLFGGTVTDSMTHPAPPDLWALALGASSTWAKLPTTGPITLSAAPEHLVTDPAADKLYAFTSRTARALDPGSLAWHLLPAAGTAPIAPDGEPQLDDRRARLLWCDHSSGVFLVHSYDFADSSWHILPTAQQPPPAGDGRHAFVADPVADRFWDIGPSGAYVLSEQGSFSPTLQLVAQRLDATVLMLHWSSPDHSVNRATVQERRDGGAWVDAAVLHPVDVTEFFYTRELNPIGSWEFRLAVTTGSGIQFFGATAVRANAAPPFDPGRATMRARTNPATRALSLDVWVPAGEAQPRDRVELYDIAGRHLVSRSLTQTASWQSIDLGIGLDLRAGVYFVRLALDGRPNRDIRVVIL